MLDPVLGFGRLRSQRLRSRRLVFGRLGLRLLHAHSGSFDGGPCGDRNEPGRGGFPGVAQHTPQCVQPPCSKSMELYARSLVSECQASMIRMVPLLDRMTIDWVCAPPAR
jgi:hypothetical protein